MLLDEAATLRGSYLGADGALCDDAASRDAYDTADRFDDLAVKLLPFCRPPLKELERQCAYCDDGRRFGGPCLHCLGTGLLPPTRGGKRVRLADLRNRAMEAM